MKELKEIGTCPNCNCSIMMYRTSNHKRFAKCEICGNSYSLPKQGKIDNSAIICPTNKYPILIIQKNNNKAYFWTDKPCFTCVSFDKCKPIKELKNEFKEMSVYGF